MSRPHPAFLQATPLHLRVRGGSGASPSRATLTAARAARSPPSMRVPAPGPSDTGPDDELGTPSSSQPSAHAVGPLDFEFDDDASSEDVAGLPVVRQKDSTRPVIARKIRVDRIATPAPEASTHAVDEYSDDEGNGDESEPKTEREAGTDVSSFVSADVEDVVSAEDRKEVPAPSRLNINSIHETGKSGVASKTSPDTAPVVDTATPASPDAKRAPPPATRASPAASVPAISEQPLASSESSPFLHVEFPEESKEAGVPPTSIKMTPEQMLVAKKKRESSDAAIAEKAKKNAERVRLVVDKAQAVFSVVGEKTGVFDLGARARASLDDLLKQAETDAASLDEDAAGHVERHGHNGDESDESTKAKEASVSVSVSDAQQTRLKGTAAAALRKVSSTLSDRWDAEVIPAVKEKLPAPVQGLSTAVITSAAVTAFCAILFLPLFLGGGDSKKAEVASSKKNVDVQTSALEKKLARSREDRAAASSSATSSSSRTSTIKSVFPPEANSPRGLTDIVKSSKPATPLATTATQTLPSNGKVPETSTAVAPPSSAPGIPSTVAPTLPAKPVVVTEASALKSIKTAVGNSRAPLVSVAAFDSLSAEPVIVLEVTHAFRSLTEGDQRSFADAALRSARDMGYETVSIVEAGTDSELVHAGVDIDLADESYTLRAQLRAVQKKADELAVRSATGEADLDALRQRLDEERTELLTQRSKLEGLLKADRSEIAQLSADLRDSRDELAQMPDRLELEKRTEAAELQTKKLEAAVEMLSRQVTIARDAEAKSIEAKAEALRMVESATLEKQSGILAADERAGMAIGEAKKESSAGILEYKKQADARVAAAENAQVLAERKAEEVSKAAESALTAELAARQQLLVDSSAVANRNLELAAKDKDSAVLQVKQQAASEVSELEKKLKVAESSIEQVRAEASKDIANICRTTIRLLRQRLQPVSGT
jgi:hypothetical protein